MGTTTTQNKLMSKFIKTLVLGSASLAFTACSGQSFSSVGSSTSNSSQSASQQPQCDIDPVDYVVSANIYDFEVTDNTNVSFGFNLSTIIKALGLSMNLTSGKMSLSMQITDPLHIATPLVSVIGTSNYSSNGFSGSIDISKIGLSAGYYYSTPFATMTQNGLTNGFSNALAKLAKVQLPWSTKIQATVNPTTFVVGAGTAAGLLAGDQLALYNVNNIWQGAPCTSQLLISQKTTSTPVAVAQVVQVGDYSSTVQIISRNWNDALDVGSVAEVFQLTGKNRVLNRSMRIGGVTSGILPVSNGTSIDLGSYAQQQIQSVITNQGFYLHP